jgi:flagellin-like protein
MIDRTLNPDKEERGQVGIGTLIVFIALVLVAAIAAGVLINTAGFLQNQAESTGQESTEQVSNAVEVQDTFGTLDGSGNIKNIKITVMKAPGADAININSSTIEYSSPNGATTLTAANPTVIGAGTGVEAYEVDSDSLIEDGERATITITLDGSDNVMENLQAGDEVTMKITTPSGSQTTVVATVPKPLTNSGDGNQVRL